MNEPLNTELINAVASKLSVLLDAVFIFVVVRVVVWIYQALMA